MKTSPREKKLAYLAWIAVCVIWGTTYLGIRICLETMPPFLMSGLRWTLAGLLLGIVLILRGEPLPRRESWGGLLALSFLFIVLGNGGVVWAEQWVASGLAAVILATSPFWMVGVELMMAGSERLTARRVVGLIIGFAGVLWLVWPSLFDSGATGAGFGVGLISLQIACIGWAIGSSYGRRRSFDENPVAVAAVEMLLGGVLTLVVATVQAEWGALYFTTRTAVSFAYLVTVGAIGGFAAYLYALKHLPLSTVSLYAYVNPVIAVILGVLILGEPFGLRMMAAAALVLAGVAVVRS